MKNLLKNLLKDNIPEKFYKIIKLLYNRLNFFETLYHIFRYHGLIKIDYYVKKKINFGSESSNSYFIRKIKTAKIYLEYGSGSSTLFVNDLCNKNSDFKYFSVDSDKNFYNFLKKKINSKNYYLYSLGYVYFYSRPILFFLRKFFLARKAKIYASKILENLEKKKLFPELILIDGRYRVLCALYCYKFIKKNNIKTTLLLDDYVGRPSYYILEKLFFSKKIGRIGVFNKLKKYQNIELLIDKFSKDER